VQISDPLETPVAVVVVASWEMRLPLPLPEELDVVPEVVEVSVVVLWPSGWVPAWALGPGTVTACFARAAEAVPLAAPGSAASATPAVPITLADTTTRENFVRASLEYDLFTSFTPNLPAR